MMFITVTSMMKMITKLIPIIFLLFLTACDNEKPKMTKLGNAIYTFCLKHPNDIAYFNDEIYTCGVYLERFKDGY
jgi:hypothetical protein